MNPLAQPHLAEAQASAEERSELPDGWLKLALGQASCINPPPPPRNALPADEPVTFVPMPAVDAACGEITAPLLRPFSRIRSGHTPFSEGDVIMAKITPCMENGKAAVARSLTHGLGFGSTEFHVLRPNGTALAEYLYQFIRQESFRKQAAEEMTGSVGQRRVPQEFIREAMLPLPPLAEQHRIVAAIDTLLAECDHVRTHLDRAARLLARFRQSVLAAACSGDLTADWRPRLDPLGFVSQDGPEPSAWSENELGELTTLVTSGSRGWARYYSTSGPLFIRSQDISTDSVDLGGVAHVQPPPSAEGERTRVNLGDTLLTITGANVTRTATVEIELEEAYVSQHVALIRLAHPELRHYLHLWLTSLDHGRKELIELAYGASKPGLNLHNIRALRVALPPIAEQVEIVRRVNALFAHAGAVEAQIAAARRRVDALTQAILAKAFRGELVPTEAELARREGRSYEPASALLARIQAEAPHKNEPGRSRTPRRRARL